MIIIGAESSFETAQKAVHEWTYEFIATGTGRDNKVDAVDAKHTN